MWFLCALIAKIELFRNHFCEVWSLSESLLLHTFHNFSNLSFEVLKNYFDLLPKIVRFIWFVFKMWTQEEGVEAELATPWTEGGAMVAVSMADQEEMVTIDKLLGKKELTLAISKACEMSSTHGNKLKLNLWRTDNTVSTSHVANSFFVFIVLQNISILWEASKFRFMEGSIPNTYNFLAEIASLAFQYMNRLNQKMII